MAPPDSSMRISPPESIYSDDLGSPISPADAAISKEDALEYWNNITTDNNGVLGGYPQVSPVDIQGSSVFLGKLRRLDPNTPDIFEHAVDCGAGIGRITLGLLVNKAKVIDIVEPVKKLTDALRVAVEAIPESAPGRLGTIYNVGLEDFTPPEDGYDLYWNQWCVGQLTDADLVEYLQRSSENLRDGGWIVVKENMCAMANNRDDFDKEDSSVTRSDEKFRKIFEQAGLVIKLTEVQKGMPAGLLVVRSYGLRPKAWS
jgi:protein N-terminal methyltransferase